MRIFLASSNPGKLREYRELAGDATLELELLPNFGNIPVFEETAPSFAENSAGKALYYSKFADEIVLADDSGLVVPVLGGAPGVLSARYAGPNATSAERATKLLGELAGKTGEERRARFVCVITIARQGRTLAVVSGSAQGLIANQPHGLHGFGYDPIFCFPDGRRTYAEASAEEKNLASHRGKAFRRLMALLTPVD